MKKLISLLLLAGVAFAGWRFYGLLRNPFGVAADAPLGTLDRVVAHLTGNEMIPYEGEAGVGELELPDPGRFNRLARRAVYVAGRGHQPIILPRGGGKLTEFVAIGADADGRVRMIVVRAHPDPPHGASGEFAREIWNAAVGGEPFFRPGESEEVDGSAAFYVAEPDTPGLGGMWKRLVVFDSLVLYMEH